MKNFFTLEGIDGSGKTTIANIVGPTVFALTQQNPVLTGEPYKETLFGKDVRELLGKYDEDIDALTELFLFQAARKQHIEDVIAPALFSGRIVICDRYILSSEAYQGAARGLPIQFVKDINALTVYEYIPDCTYWLHTDIDVCMSRNKNENAKDRKPMSYYEDCESAYAAHRGESNFMEIDGNKPIEEIVSIIAKDIAKRVELASKN